MKKILFTLAALMIATCASAQLIANKTDNKFTVNLDFFTDFQVNPSSNWDARMFNQGFSCALTYNFPLGESKKHTISIGLGYAGHNYFSYTRINDPYTTETYEYTAYREDGTVTTGFRRYKLNCNYIEVPFELRFRIKDAWKIGVGFKVGYNVMSKTKFVGNNDNGILIREKYCYISNMEKLAYAATLRIGYKWVSLFGAIQISPIFESGHDAPTFTPITVGLTFAPF